jgi:uncharacterized membrane protein YfcA
MDLYLITMITLGLLAGGFVKGITGMGMPLVSIPLIAAVIGLPGAIGLMTISYIVSNLWQIIANARHAGPIAPLLWRFLICGTLGAGLGSLFMTAAPVDLLSIILGVLLMLYCLTRVLAPDLTVGAAKARHLAPLLGLLSGVLHGATGISSPLGGPYFHAVTSGRQQYLFAVSAMLLLFSVTQGAVLLISGVVEPQLLAWSGLAVIPVFAAMQAGHFLASRINPRIFDYGLLLFLTAMGARLLIVGVMCDA